jgi:hypothetical protein
MIPCDCTCNWYYREHITRHCYRVTNTIIFLIIPLSRSNQQNKGRRGYSTTASTQTGTATTESGDVQLSETIANAMLSDAIANYDPSKDLGSPEDFQQVANGVFQAEGSISAYIRGTLIKPLFTLGQALSPGSLAFFVRLWHTVGKAGTLRLVLSADNRWILRLDSQSWTHILGVFTNYFCFVYGEKFIGFRKLAAIYRIGNSSASLEVFKLVYSLTTTSSQRLLSLPVFLASVGIEYDGNSNPSTVFTDNFQVPSLLFLLGLWLGDGTFSIRIRLVAARKGNLWLIPTIRLAQLNSAMNQHLFDMFAAGVKALGVSSHARADKRGMLDVVLEGSTNVLPIIDTLFTQHIHFLYWKYPQLEMLYKYSVFVKSGIHSTHIGLIAILEMIYSYPSERDHSLGY